MSDVYSCPIGERQRAQLVGSMRRIHGWCPANEGRACRCERCVRRRRHRHAHRVRR